MCPSNNETLADQTLPKENNLTDGQAPTKIVVNGEAMLDLPNDLYIPPEALEIFLDTFQGPLDLLLYLIRKQNIDILNIPIAKITGQYMQYVELMRKFRLDLASEYLLMAAMLAQIKSRLLLPRPSAESTDEEADPRAALMRQLQKYEQFSLAATQMDDMPRLERELHLSHVTYVPDMDKEILPQASLNELVLAFQRVMIRSQHNQQVFISSESLSFREKMVHILEHLQNNNNVRFESLLNTSEGREGVVVSFIAVLELLRDGLIQLVQNEAYSPIHIKVAI